MSQETNDLTAESGGDSSWITRLNDLSSIDDLDNALQRLFVLPIAAAVFQTAAAIEAVTDIVVVPADQFGTELGDVVEEIVGGPATVIGAGVDSTETALADIGLAGFPVSLVIMLIGGFIVSWYLGLDRSSNWLPFSFTDLPFVGVDEDAEE